jgi:hypothetical protein
MHELLELGGPLIILGALLGLSIWGVTKIRHRTLREIAGFCVVVEVFVLPWLVNLVTFGVLWDWYRRANPYPGWDISLTYVYALNLFFLYLEAAVIGVGSVLYLNRRKGD